MANFSKEWYANEGADPLEWGELNPDMRGELSKPNRDRITTWSYLKQSINKIVTPNILGTVGSIKVGYITKLLLDTTADTNMKYQTYESVAHRETIYIRIPTDETNPDGTTRQEMVARNKPKVLKSNKIRTEDAGLAVVRIPEFDSQKPIPARFTHNTPPTATDVCLNKIKHSNVIQELAGNVYEVSPGLELKEGYVVKVQMRLKSKPSLGGTILEVVRTAGGQPLIVPVSPARNITEQQCKDWANITMQMERGDNPIPRLPKPTWDAPPVPINTVNTLVTALPATPYQENRIRALAFGTLSPTSPLLVKSKHGGDRAHKLLIKRFDIMADAFRSETNLPLFKISDGIRKFGRSDSTVRTDIGVEGQTVFENVSWHNREEYEQQMKRIYGSVRVGAGRIAYMSPHMTGLAIDLSWIDPESRAQPGLSSNTARWDIESQKTSRAFIWLKANAHKYGFSPYIKEPWHWECLIPRENWKSGQEFISDKPFTGGYAVRVKEASIKSQKLTTNVEFSRSKFA